MKTKKFFALALVFLFAFSPFLNLESWAMTAARSPLYPQTLAVGYYCVWYCSWADDDNYCCQKYCCDSPAGRSCRITDDFCIEYPEGPSTNLK